MRGRLPHWVGNSGITIALALGLAMAVAPNAGAQSLSVPATAVLNAGNTGDNFSDGLVTGYQNKSTVTVVSSTTSFFRVRYQETIAADVGFGGSDHTQSANSDYTVSFTVNTPGSYRLHVATSVKGAFTVVDERGSVHFGLDLNLNVPRACIRGYEATRRRSPHDTTVRSALTGTSCKEPRESPTDVRGSRNTPAPLPTPGLSGHPGGPDRTAGPNSKE